MKKLTKFIRKLVFGKTILELWEEGRTFADRHDLPPQHWNCRCVIVPVINTGTEPIPDGAAVYYDAQTGDLRVHPSHAQLKTADGIPLGPIPVGHGGIGFGEQTW